MEDLRGLGWDLPDPMQAREAHIINDGVNEYLLGEVVVAIAGALDVDTNVVSWVTLVLYI